MPSPVYSAEQLRGFREAAQSLRLYRRADLSDADTDEPLIEPLYVDPLPADQILVTALRPNTTFLIGRKGTGKSTVFQRLQHELRKSKNKTSAYIDIKTLFESCQVDSTLLQRLQQTTSAMPADGLHRLLLHREFLRQMIIAIKTELGKRVDASLWERIKDTFTGSRATLFEGLDEILDDANDDQFVSVLGVKLVQLTESASSSAKSSTQANASLTVSQAPSATAGASATNAREASASEQAQFADVLMRTFDIREFLVRLRALLERLGVRNLYVLIDDFSELPEDAMRVVVDTLLAPLNNWSDEFVKLKIAAYPGRIYYGAIDKTKIDECYLDLYRLYGLADVSSMEESAIEFTRRLVVGRLSHFCPGVGASDFFESDLGEGAWRLLFFATMANPRNLGYLMHFLYESHLINQRPITSSGITEAARRYYEEKVEPYFALGKFLHESFGERSSIFSLKELLEDIVQRARDLRSHDSAVFQKIRGRPPTSHFHVISAYDALLSTLELNFFITKYYEMTDRDGRKVTVFALNFGLCDKYTISFGRPSGEREFRLYFVERVFDYTPIILNYLQRNQEIQCEACGQKQPLDKLEALRLYHMRCPACGTGTCKVSNLSRKYEHALQAVTTELLLPRTELGILQTINQEGEPLRASAIAAELDCSYQLVGKRGKLLEDRGLVERLRDEGGTRLFEITATAKHAYFSDPDVQSLDLPNDTPQPGGS